MLIRLVTWTGCLAWCALAVVAIPADEPKPAAQEAVKEEAKPAAVTRQIGDLAWHTDYSTAYREAKDERKQLLLYFRDDKDLLTAGQFEQNVLARPELKEPLSKLVRVMLFTSALAPLPKD